MRADLTLVPALAFLLAAVPLADLLDRLGFFDAVAARLAERSPQGVSVGALWLVAAATTVVLNLDTTIVLLTPLYVRLARRSAADEVALASVPLLLASLASSVLPVSNLTNLIALETWDVGTGAFVARTALPSLAAVVVGWSAYRRRHPVRLAPAASHDPADRRALRIGSAVVGALLVGFVAGPAVGVAPWIVTLVADVGLAGVLRTVPWRRIPLATALGVGAVGVLVIGTVGDTVARAIAGSGSGPPVPLAGVAVAGALAANLVNNLPALVAGVGTSPSPTWAGWAWLLGVNVGAVLLPWGALANLLWLRILRVEGSRIGVRRYVAEVAPIALPAFTAAVVVLVAEAAVLR